MKTNYLVLFLFAAFCCMGVQCKEERTELEMLPPVTTYGANTFGCLINGRAWPVYEKGGRIDAQYNNGKLVINYSTFEPNQVGGWGPGQVKEYISITTNKIHSKGFYAIQPILGVDGFGLEYDGVKYSARYNSNDDAICYINMLRLDSIKHIISGEFNFSLSDEDNESRVNIEHGRFDIFYQ
ncbi:MAG: hypothetical protein WC150_13755 [Bacteroidia bacterium]